jgi:hypothetical protein
LYQVSVLCHLLEEQQVKVVSVLRRLLDELQVELYQVSLPDHLLEELLL